MRNPGSAHLPCSRDGNGQACEALQGSVPLALLGQARFGVWVITCGETEQAVFDSARPIGANTMHNATMVKAEIPKPMVKAEIPKPASQVDGYVYSVGIIDFWTGWQDLSSLINASIRDYDNFPPTSPAVSELEAIVRFVVSAMLAAEKLGWEGDIRPGSGPFLSGIPWPDDNYSKLMLGWKQDNNGSTFIASPIPLPWLDEHPKTTFRFAW